MAPQSQKLRKSITLEIGIERVEISLGETREQRIGETREQYCRTAANWARGCYNRLRSNSPHRYCHESFAVRDALLATEAKFVGMGTFGVESIRRGNNQRSPVIDYLNTGDSYGVTVLVVNGRFCVGCWGDIVEQGSYD